MIWKPYEVGREIEISEFYSLFTAHFEKGYCFGGEIHDFWECLYLIKGEMSVSADEKVYDLTSGDIIIHKPMELHKFSVNGTGGAYAMVVSFSMTGSLTDTLKDKVFSLNRVQKGAVENFLNYLEQNALADTGKNGQKRYLYHNYRGNISLSVTETYIKQILFSVCGESVVNQANTDKDASIFFDAVKIYEKNLNTQISVDDLAARLHISASGLKRIFKKYTGTGVHKYGLKLRIRRAGEYIKEGKTVTETAEILGFSSQAYFSEAFKREMGFPPSEIKKN